MARTLMIIAMLLYCSLPVGGLQAQLRGPAAPSAAREPARIGLLGGLREARDERFRREAQSAQRTAPAGAIPGAISNPNTDARQPARVNNKASLRDLSPNAAPSSPQRSAATIRGGLNVRTAPVVPATASAIVPVPLYYNGPGVAIRLPRDARGIVIYLVDEAEKIAIRPGEQQVLDDKGSYVVRYSRGITKDGRSFGESRYTISEGRYRFELTETGWELYREGEVDSYLAPPNRLDFTDGPVSEGPLNDLAQPQNSIQSDLRLNLPSQSPATETPYLNSSDSVDSDSVDSEPVGEAVLPAPKPRSILE